MSDTAIEGEEVVVFEDPAKRDIFGRFRQSEATTIFENLFEYSLNPSFWDTIAVGGGTVSQDSPTNRVILSVGTVSGDKAAFQQRRYNRFSPSKTQSGGFSFLFGAPISNIKRQIGFFDDNNGVFLQQDNTGISVITRNGGNESSPIYQNTWNMDKLDGSGQSGYVLDFTKIQVIIIEFLPSISFRISFYIQGKPVVAHMISVGNALSSSLIGTPNLPLRAEIKNTGTSVGGSFSFSAAAVFSEGGSVDLNREGYPFSALIDVNSPIVINTTEKPMISIRLRNLFSGKTNRGYVIPYSFSSLSTAKNLSFSFILNPILTSATFSNTVDSNNSLVEYDTAATAFSGGRRIYSGNVTSANSVFDIKDLFNWRYPLSLNAAGTSSDVLTLVGVANGATNVSLSLNWKEFY